MSEPRRDDKAARRADAQMTPPEREPGRPTGTTDEDGLRAGRPAAATPTEAPEERGQIPSIENAPGGDL